MVRSPISSKCGVSARVPPPTPVRGPKCAGEADEEVDLAAQFVSLVSGFSANGPRRAAGEALPESPSGGEVAAITSHTGKLSGRPAAAPTPVERKPRVIRSRSTAAGKSTGPIEKDMMPSSALSG